jgi:hypothetical protein
MSEATPFKALGRGNGFPFCTLKVDVSTFDNYQEWTLGQAMKIYWSLSGINGFFNLVDVDTLEDIKIENVKLGDFIEYDQSNGSETSDDSDYTDVDPEYRVCNRNRSGEKFTDLGRGFNDYGMSINLASNSIVKYYNGDTSDEDNFLGYGMKQDSINNQLAYAYGFEVDGPVKFKHTILTTYYKASDYSPYSPSTSIVTIADIPFIKIEIGQGLGSDIDSLEFYTYS